MRAVGKSLRRILDYQGDWEGGDSTSIRRGGVGSAWRWYSRPPGPNEANDERSRMEVIRKVQHFERNNSVVNKTLDLIELYSAGATGMPVIPASSDEEWNGRRKLTWERWCENPDLTSRDGFGTMQRLMVRCRARDGRVLVYLTRSDTPVRSGNERFPQYRPRIQLIEAARLQTPPEMTGKANIVDGIELDGKGRPIFYYVTEDEGGGWYGRKMKFRKLPAEFVIDFNLRMRPGELHPMSLFAPVLNDIQDLNELAAWGIDKAKEAATTGTVYKTADAELPTEEDVRKEQYDVASQTENGTNITLERLEQIKQIRGVNTIAIGLNESIEQLESKSPNQIEREHWDIILNRICTGTGVSRLMVSPVGIQIQGTVARGEYDIASGFFRAGSSDLAEVIRRIYAYVTWEESRFDSSIADGMPKDWWKCHVRFPRACNVDVGRNSAAAIAEYQMGMRTLQSVYGPLGEDAFEQIDIGMKELAFIKQRGGELGISAEEFSQKISDASKEGMEKETKAQEDEEKEELVTA